MRRSFSLSTLITIGGLVGYLPLSWAADCSDRNLETESGSVMQHIPVYDQDGTGICYAYAASELMNAYLLSKTPDSKELVVHPALAAINYSSTETDGGGELAEGDVIKAIRETRDKPLYSYSSVSNSLNKAGGSSGVTESEMLQYMEDLGAIRTSPFQKAKATLRAYTSFPRPASGLLMTDDVRPIEISRQLKRLSFELAPIPSTCRPTGAADLEQFAMTTAVTSAVQIARASVLDSDAIQALPPVPAPQQLAWSGTPEPKLKDLVRSHFAGKDGHLPLGMSFCSKVLSDPSARKLDRQITPDGKPKTRWLNDCRGHAALLTGTRSNGGKCEYLLRNSWGSGFRPGPERTCVCQHQGDKSYHECPSTGRMPDAHQFKIVSCWISEDELVPNLFGLQLIADPAR